MVGLVSLWERALSLSFMWTSREKATTYNPESRFSPDTPDLLAPWSWMATLQNCWEINGWWLRYSVDSISVPAAWTVRQRASQKFLSWALKNEEQRPNLAEWKALHYGQRLERRLAGDEAKQGPWFWPGGFYQGFCDLSCITGPSWKSSQVMKTFYIFDRSCRCLGIGWIDGRRARERPNREPKWR